MNLDFLQNNPELNNIDPKKLEFLMNLASENPPTNTKDIANVLMGAEYSAVCEVVFFQRAVGWCEAVWHSRMIRLEQTD